MQAVYIIYIPILRLKISFPIFYWKELVVVLLTVIIKDGDGGSVVYKGDHRLSTGIKTGYQNDGFIRFHNPIIQDGYTQTSLVNPSWDGHCFTDWSVVCSSCVERDNRQHYAQQFQQNPPSLTPMVENIYSFIIRFFLPVAVPPEDTTLITISCVVVPPLHTMQTCWLVLASAIV